MGYGIVDALGGSMRHVAHGVVSSAPSEPLGIRIKRIYDETILLLDEYKPHACSMEALFFSKNVTSALSVAECRGVIRLACAQYGMQVTEYPPVTLKKAVVGSGRAEKAEVQRFVALVLGLREVPKPDHAADALACAIAHANTSLAPRLPS